MRRQVRVKSVPRYGLRVQTLLAGVLATALAGAPAAAQQLDSIPGVTLGLLYEAEFQPALAILPFSGRLGGEATASEVQGIMARDLRYSDRF